MPELQIPPVARLLLEVAASRLWIKVLQREVADLKARLGERDQTNEI
jgi:hypothetical protein